MKRSSVNVCNRRQFVKRTINSALSCSAASIAANLSLGTRVLAQSSTRFSDEKALVCIFLYGGNDSYNLLIPTATQDYATYADVRQNLAYQRENIVALTPKTANAYEVGMPSQAQALHTLFQQNQLSVVANIGPMVQPATKEVLLANEAYLPPQLFSHNDQQSLWQSSTLDTATAYGWGGKVADLIGDTNDLLPMNFTLFGNNLFQSAQYSQPLSVDQNGPETFAALDRQYEWNQTRIAAFERILADVNQPLERAYRSQMVRAEANNQRILDTLETVPESEVVYPAENHLAGQLQMIAKLIAGQSTTGQSRQIYFAGMGGWDTHDNQSSEHPRLLQILGEAMLAFQNDLDARALSEKVTTFTSSEFGRTLTSNGDGTDHGWAGHQMVMGGAIQGGEIFNTLPALALGSNDDLDDGRMIPTLSVDQLGANLVKWFGLSESETQFVFPNLNRFDANALNIFT